MADGTLPNERGGTEEAPSSVTTTKTSEITIIMKTLVSNTTTTTTTSKAVKKCECNCGGSADGSTIEVTTSVRSVFECPAGCNKAALLEPILASNFMTLLKTANDSSSFENVLEFKSLLGPPVQPVLKTSRENLLGGGDTSQDVRKFLSDLGQHNASVCCKTSRDDSATSCCVNNNNEGERSCLEKNNISVIESVAKDSKHCLSSSSESDTAGAGSDSAVFKKPKICDDMKSVRFTVSRVVEESGAFAAKLPSSTPIKRSGSEDYKLNLLTPPADASFIDSDFESMEQDQYDTCSSKESLKLEETCLCVRKEPKEVEPFNPEELFPEPTHVRETLQTPARVRKTSSTKAFFEEALKTPLALRKRFQKRRSSEIPKQHSHSNLLQFFSSRKKSTSLDGVQRPVQAKRSITSDNSSDTSRCASPTLTEENLRRLSNAVRIADLSNRTLVWGENFDYSFECEPSHSDVEEEDEPEDPDDPVATRLVQFNISPDSSFEMQPPIVPTFKIDPPQAINIASELAQGLIVESCMKRSVSDPIRLKARSLSCTPLTSDIGESEEDEEEVPIMKEAAHVHFHSVHEASLRSLDKIGVSEQNLLADDNKQINPNASPFRRWGQSSLRSRSGEQRTPSSAHRRPSSLAASESDVYTKSIDDDYSSTKSGYNPYADVAGTAAVESAQTQAVVSSGPAGVASWGTSFEKLLEDPAGLHTFSEFLKKEFSAENIYFWTACERYRQLVDREERAKEAQAIFAKHLESGCSEPVNVDSIARNIAQENLPQAEQTLFGAASKQIFNLMKFDSYQRFIKSDMYRACQEAEAKGHPLPYPGDLLDPLLRTSFAVQGATAATKLKKSLSNAEDRRRKSLLPWHRKTRCKSKDRGDAELKKEGGGGGGKSTLSTGGSGGGGGNGTGGSSNTLKVLSTNSTSDIHSSRSSLASFDAAIGKSYDQEDQTRNTLCRVILSNGATTVVQTRSNETIKELVERLLEKRGIVYTAYEAFLAGNHKPLDLDGPSSSLAGREVNIDQRVVFKLSLPNRKMISVKSKATKPLGDVLRPILLKYNYELDQMNVYSKEAYLDMTYPVTSVDGLWLQVRNGNENDFHQDLTRTIASRSERAYANQVPPLPIIATSQHAQIINHFHQQLQSSQHNGFLNNNNVTKKSQLAYGGQSHHNLKGKDEQPADAAAAGGKQELNMLDEITNKVFNELMNGKIANGPKVPAEDCTSDSSSTRRGDRFRRRGSNAPSESGRGAKSKKCSTAGSEDGGESVGNAVTGVKKPIIAKLKAGVKLQIPTRSQNDELLEGLKRAQRSRLEDQRGTEINFELPDFLKDKENFTSTTTTTAGSSSAAAAMATPSSKFTRKFAKRPESAEFPLGASTNGGSLQQIHKPQPAPRLSISRGGGAATGATGAGNPSSPPVQSASSESNLNNLSLRCNASPLTLDDNGNGSQSENSYAEATMIFTHASANPHHSPGSSPPSSHRYHHLDGSSAAVDHHHYEAIDGSSAADLVDGGVIYHPPYHRHPHQHHNLNQQQQHRLSASTSSGSSTGSSSSSSGSTSSSSSDADNQKGPPPLPPKPKILPIKPSNWGHSSGMSASMCNLPTAASGGGSSSSQNGVCGSNNNNSVSSNISGKEKRLSGTDQKQVQQTRSVYLDHASSSFV